MILFGRNREEKKEMRSEEDSRKTPCYLRRSSNSRSAKQHMCCAYFHICVALVRLEKLSMYPSFYFMAPISRIFRGKKTVTIQTKLIHTIYRTQPLFTPYVIWINLFRICTNPVTPAQCTLFNICWCASKWMRFENYCRNPAVHFFLLHLAVVHQGKFRFIFFFLQFLLFCSYHTLTVCKFVRQFFEENHKKK